MIWSQLSLNLDPEIVTFMSVPWGFSTLLGGTGWSEPLELIISLPQVSQTLMTPGRLG